MSEVSERVFSCAVLPPFFSLVPRSCSTNSLFKHSTSLLLASLLTSARLEETRKQAEARRIENYKRLTSAE
jgi:hypothetical protein